MTEKPRPRSILWNEKSGFLPAKVFKCSIHRMSISSQAEWSFT
jgi:hypothetical protein